MNPYLEQWATPHTYGLWLMWERKWSIASSIARSSPTVLFDLAIVKGFAHHSQVQRECSRLINLSKSPSSSNTSCCHCHESINPIRRVRNVSWLGFPLKAFSMKALLLALILFTTSGVALGGIRVRVWGGFGDSCVENERMIQKMHAKGRSVISNCEWTNSKKIYHFRKTFRDPGMNDQHFLQPK